MLVFTLGRTLHTFYLMSLNRFVYQCNDVILFTRKLRLKVFIPTRENHASGFSALQCLQSFITFYTHRIYDLCIDHMYIHIYYKHDGVKFPFMYMSETTQGPRPGFLQILYIWETAAAYRKKNSTLCNRVSFVPKKLTPTFYISLLTFSFFPHQICFRKNLKYLSSPKCPKPRPKPHPSNKAESIHWIHYFSCFSPPLFTLRQ